MLFLSACPQCAAAAPAAPPPQKKITLSLRTGGRVSPMGSWGSWGTPRPYHRPSTRAMATWLSEFAARLLSACAATIFPFAPPVPGSCTSSSTAPAHAMATWVFKLSARLPSARAA
eukprot:863933-Prorocentrum_minimum.AAC.1